MRQLLFTLLLLCPLLSDAQECVSGDCENGYGTYTWLNGEKYFGEWKDSKRHGQGTWTSSGPITNWTYGYGGEKYIGEWFEGKRHGQGIETGTTAERTEYRYFGEYKDGKKHGQGTLTTTDGRKYVGEWKDGEIHGQATLTWPNASRSSEHHRSKYVGEFSQYDQQGRGVYISGWGGQYDGEWLGGCMWGYGIETGYYGDKYEGEWKCNKKHGQGTMTYSDGSKYVGEWKDNKRTGYGIWTFNGYKYEGEHKNGLQHGQGTATYSDGSKYVGEWEDDKKHGIGTMTWADGSKYVGEWVKGVFLETKLVHGETIQMIKQPGGTYTIPCEVNGLPLTFIFDTGASDVLLSSKEALVMIQQGYLKESDITGTQKYSIANGDIIEGATFNIRQLKIGDILLEDINATIIYEAEAPLLLGQSAIIELGTIQINPETNILTIAR